MDEERCSTKWECSTYSDVQAGGSAGQGDVLIGLIGFRQQPQK